MIVVFGSLNVDLVFALPVLPRPDETVLGTNYRIAPGGKGANQAVAAARDGASVRFYGCVGPDAFGALVRASLVEAGVDVAGLVGGSVPTGCAAICVDACGRNLIAVASGANLEARAAQVPDSALNRDTTVVLQMETPPDDVAAVIARAKARGSRVVLNLAPALPLDRAALSAVDVLVVNEAEGAALARAQGIDGAEAAALVRRLADRLGNRIIVTCGERGAVAAGGGEAWAVDALPIATVDTTAAGDCFVGVLAVALGHDATLAAALHRASVAAGLTCLVPGAQPSLPTKIAIDARLGDLPPARRLAE